MSTYMKLTENIELKLENDETHIYINGQRFIQCKYLLINVDTNKPKPEHTLESIDELKRYYSNELEGNDLNGLITPETEFFGHCSNLQAWIENDYNPNLLHSNLSIPLLKELVEYDVRVFSSLMYHLDDMYRSYECSHNLGKEFTYQRKMNLLRSYGKIVKGALERFDLQKYESLSVFIRNLRLLELVPKLFPFAQKYCDMCESWKLRYDEYHNDFVEIDLCNDPFDLTNSETKNICPECYDVIHEYDYEHCSTCGNLFENSNHENVRFVESYDEYMCNSCLKDTFVKEGLPNFQEHYLADDLTLRECEIHNWHYIGSFDMNDLDDTDENALLLNEIISSGQNIYAKIDNYKYLASGAKIQTIAVFIQKEKEFWNFKLF